MTSTRSYVLGFFTDATHVALIRKRRPTWQAGLLNGIGGRVEALETARDAMHREFREETGVADAVNWRMFCVIDSAWTKVAAGSGCVETPRWRTAYRVFCFHASGDLAQLRTVTDEPLEIHPHAHLPLDLVGKVRWLVPLALDTGLVDPVPIRHTDAEIGPLPDDDRGAP